jgi:arginyl-tRNA synthetase
MLRDTLRDIVAKAVASLQEADQLPNVEVPAFDVERPPVPATHGDHQTNVAMRLAPRNGDYATNVAMKLAAVLRAAGEKPNPRALAETIAARIRETVSVVPAYDLVSAVEVAGPGFINLRLDPGWLLRQTAAILAAGDTFGRVDVGHGRTVNLEFVSANPTGPVTVGNGRGAFIGDALSRVMRAAGYDVTNEYYFNDYGGQINKLGYSTALYCRLLCGQPVSCALDADHEVAGQGYYSPYHESVAARILAAQGSALLDLPAAERDPRLGKAAADLIMSDIQRTMRRFNVEFDVWFNQSSLDTSGALQQGIERLRAGGFLEERDGALWMTTTRFGDDKDRVIVKSNGDPTYIASDVAYMHDKFARGFQTLILVLGPDHHGYVGRLKATSGMLGHQPEDAHVLIYGQVMIKMGERSVKMGKRLGNAVTLDELDEEVGPDVTRFFYLMRGNDTPLDFDLELARKQSSDNPGLSVQYAYARVSGVFRKAGEMRIMPDQYERADMLALAHDVPDELAAELGLLRQLLRLEEVVERAALALEPHHLTRYGMDLAEAYHIFYDSCPVLKAGVEISPAVRMARLRLMAAARAGLARLLALLGMEAPERMERAETA